MAYVTDKTGTRHILTRQFADGVVVIRALDAPYVNAGDTPILVVASIQCAVPAAADEVTIEAQAGTPLATMSQVRALTGAGLADEVDLCIVMVVNAGEVYQLTTTLVGTGVATLLYWHEMILV